MFKRRTNQRKGEKMKNIHIQTSFLIEEKIGYNISVFHPVMSTGTMLYIPYTVGKNIKVIL